MRRAYVIGFFLLLVFDTWAQVSLKLAGERAGPFTPDLHWILQILESGWTYVAILGYLGAFGTWMRLLRDAPVGPAFAASHLDVVSVVLISVYAFGETLGVVRVLGCIAIVVGIFCIAASEESPARS